MKKNITLIEEIAGSLSKVRKARPIVDCLTNRVTINDCANILLACGGSPIMAEDEREIEEIVGISSAVVLNMGILKQDVISAMIKAGRCANQQNKVVLLDPVGMGASALRNDTAKLLLQMAKPSVIRGNMSEIKALCGVQGTSRGVDASFEDAVTEESLQKQALLVRDLAKSYGCVVCGTGAVDILSDGEKTVFLKNGHPMLCDVTGTGCMLSAMAGAFCSVAGAFAGMAAAVTVMNLAGEKAAMDCRRQGDGIGTFRIKLLDYIYTLKETDVLEMGAVFGGE